MPALASLEPTYFQLVSQFLTGVDWILLLSASHSIRNLKSLGVEFGRNYVYDQISVLISVLELRRNVVITGPAGSGKSTLLHSLVSRALASGLRVACTGMTGMACLQLPEGRTLHSFSGLGKGTIPVHELQSSIAKHHLVHGPNSHKYPQWNRIDLLIIDEASMLGAQFLRKVDLTAREGRGQPHRPLGGVQVVLVGDWYQLPPIGDSHCFTSPLWGALSFRFHLLTFIHRQVHDPAFRHLLNRVRVGEHTEADMDTLRLRHRVTQEIPWEVRDKAPVYLLPYNQEVVKMNEEAFGRVPGPIVSSSVAVDRVLQRVPGGPGGRHVWRESAEVSVAAARAIIGKYIEARCSAVLHFKDGAQYILTRNVDLRKGQVNGSRVLYEADEKEPAVVFENGEKLPLSSLLTVQQFPIFNKPGFALQRKQFTLKMGYAQSIHSSQGGTFQEVKVSVGKNVRQTAQVYVGLSRGTSLEGLFITDFDPKAIRTCPQVKRFYSQMSGGQ